MVVVGGGCSGDEVLRNEKLDVRRGKARVYRVEIDGNKYTRTRGDESREEREQAFLPQYSE